MLDKKAQETLRVEAATLAQWLKDNHEVRDFGPNDDRYPMWVLATSWLRLYYELIQAGIIDTIKQELH